MAMSRSQMSKQVTKPGGKLRGVPKGLTYFKKGGAASKNQKVVKFVLLVKRGLNVLLIHIQVHMQTWQHLNIVKILITPKVLKARRRKNNGCA